MRVLTSTRGRPVLCAVVALRRGEKGEKGEKGERECAFHLDGVVKDHPNRILIHDLRIGHEGEVA